MSDKVFIPSFLLVVAVFVACVVFHGRYSKPNGYSFAWQDFKIHHVVAADLNGDGETTGQEMDEFTQRWLKERGLTKRQGFPHVFDAKGDRLTAQEFVEKYGPFDW